MASNAAVFVAMYTARKEFILTLLQKSGIVLITLTDALIARWMGDEAIGGFGLASLSLVMVAVVVGPHITVASSEGTAALEGDHRDAAAQLFGAASLPPLMIPGVITLIVAVTLIPDFAFGDQAAAAADYLRWSIPAMVIGVIARGSVKALRAAGDIVPTMISSWVLAGVNLAFGLIAAHIGWGVEGLGFATLMAELVSAPIAMVAARRRGLIAMPSWQVMRSVERTARGMLVATIPELLVKGFTLKTREMMGREELARFTMMRESLSAGDQISAQVAKAGSNRAMRGAEGLDLALAWSWKFRALAVPAVWVIAGWQTAAALVLMEVALREYIAQRTARDYVAQARSEGAEQVTRLALFALLSTLNLLTADNLLWAWLTGNAVYVIIGRHYRARER